MLLHAWIMFLFMGLATSSSFPEVTSYARVSRNGQRSEGRSLTAAISSRSRTNGSSLLKDEGRGLKDIVITVSPVYAPAKMSKLKEGEAVDLPSTPKYTTLDEELLKEMDIPRKQDIQARFHPPASFEHSVAHSNAMRQQMEPNPNKYLAPIYSSNLNYKPDDYYTDKRPDFSDKPISKPIFLDPLNSAKVENKPQNGYKTLPSAYEFDDFGGSPVLEDASKPIYSNHQEDHSDLGHVPYQDQDFHHDQELSYDHVPEYHQQGYHHHDHDDETTEMPETNDQRLDKRPYSYYFIGKKLWYVPLYFSIYFIIYVAALVLKSVARHKINFPTNLAEAAHARNSQNVPGWWEFTNGILLGVERFAETLAGEPSTHH
ncbi:uncharacterized protein [Prorops nasuta]|uniref:uncharacterized protein n=1 Tax=Prorops nasuta TaxID=863751 RepID=UPI0034CF0FDD